MRVEAEAHEAVVGSESIERALKLAVPVLIAIGLAFRLTYYLRNRSLSIDEASLALNLMHRSYSQLFDRLDFNQAAPAGFLVLQKLALNAFGTSPHALRLVPLLAGALSCLLIYPVSARIVGRPAAVVALALVAVSEPLLSYASTNKQYSVDVAVALALYATTLVVRRRLGTRQLTVLALAGALAVWLSHPAAFVLAGVGLALAIQSFRDRRWSELTKLTGVGTLWLTSFAAAYLLTRTSIEQVQRSSGGFSTDSASESGPNVVRTAGGVIRNVLGIPGLDPGLRAAVTLVAVGLCFVGAAALLRRDSALAALLIVPGIAVVLAVWASRYPDFSRTFLFLVPALTVLVGAGSVFMVSRHWPRIIGLTAGLVIVPMIGLVAFEGGRVLRAPGGKVESALTYLARHARSNDSLYVSRGAQYDFRYYLECGCFSNPAVVSRARELWPIRPAAGHAQFAAALKSVPPRFVAGSATGTVTRAYGDELAPFVGQSRVWVLAVNSDPRARRALTRFLQSNGRQLDSFRYDTDHVASSLVLYSLRRGR